MIKLCVFDFDSALVDGETIDILANAYGMGDEVKIITQKAMNGELDFFESLHRRVALLRGMSRDDVLGVSQNLPLMKGNSGLIGFLSSKNIICVVFSGGSHEGVDYAMEEPNFELGFTNYLRHENGKLTGLVDREMMFSNSKGLMLERLKRFLNLSQEEMVRVGDGANDLAMFEHSGFKIAFYAKEILRANVSMRIGVKDLRETIKVM